MQTNQQPEDLPRSPTHVTVSCDQQEPYLSTDELEEPKDLVCLEKTANTAHIKREKKDLKILIFVFALIYSASRLKHQRTVNARGVQL